MVLHDSIQRVNHLKNDSGNQNLRLQRLLDKSQDELQRVIQMYTNALNNKMKARRES